MTSFVPQSVRPHAADSRLLSNLVRAEKDYVSNLSASVHSGNTAASALAAWGTSEVQDVGATSEQVARLLHDVAEAQRTHVQAIEGYRAALKDILDRESSIRDIVRDRDILVNRLIKASKKKVKEGKQEERELKIQDAQRELQACEQVLASEEAALIGVKRRTFKEALTMRMKTMGDVGNAMVESAQEAILLLDEFDANVVGAAMLPTGGGEVGYVEDAEYYDSFAEPPPEVHPATNGYPTAADTSTAFEVASVTPSQSASQVAGPTRFAALGAPMHHDNSVNTGVPAPHQLGPDVGTGGEPFMPSDNKAPIPPPPSHPTASVHRERIASASVAPPQSQGLDLGPLPSAYQAGSSQQQQQQFLQPSAAGAFPAPGPTPPEKDFNAVAFPSVENGAAGQQVDDSSSEEDERPTVAHQGGGARMVPPPPPGPAVPARGGHARHASADISSTATGQSYDRNAGAESPQISLAKKKSIFGRVGRLFKTDVATASQPNFSVAEADGNPQKAGWHTRTDSNLRNSSRNDVSATGLSRSASRRSALLAGHAFQGPSRGAEDDSSDDEPDARDIVRVVNPARPLWQSTASDVGPSPLKRGFLKRTDSSASRISINAGPLSWKQKQEDDETARLARLSVVGAGIGGATTSAVNLAGTAEAPKKKKKKVKKAPSIAGSEIGTSATRVGPAAPSASINKRTSVIVPGDASSGIRRSDSLNTTGGRSASKSKKRQSLSSYSLSEGKFATANWVAHPAGSSVGEESSRPRTAADFAANAGVVPRGEGPTLRDAVSAATQHVQENAYNTTTKSSSLSRASSIKPAIKASLGRSNSIRSASGASSRPALPDMGPVIRAPPPAASLLDSDKLYKGPVAGQMPAMPAPIKAPGSSIVSASSLPAPGPLASSPAPTPKKTKKKTSTATTASVGLGTEPSLVFSRASPTASPSAKHRASEAPRLSDLSERRSRESDAESFSSARDDAAAVPKSDRPLLSTTQSFDGTGALNVSLGDVAQTNGKTSTEAAAAPVPAQSSTARSSAPLPKLEMPISEPFSVSLDGSARKGSAAAGSDADPSSIITPGEHSAIAKLLSTGDEEDTNKVQVQVKPQQTNDTGVTRHTVRSTKLVPSRTYGSGALAPELSSSSSEDEAGTGGERHVLSLGMVTEGTESSAGPGTGSKGLTAPTMSALRSQSPAPKSVLVNAGGSAGRPASVAGSIMSDVSSSAVGSKRPKSVRLAPDTKLPPETPTSPTPPSIPFHAHAPGSSVVSANDYAPTSRIAPPPAAPARPAKEGPVSLSNDTTRSSGWTSRISSVQLSDSSDDEVGDGEGVDEYARARRAFSNASRHLGKATGVIKPKKKSDDTASVGKSSTKKSSKPVNFGYNPEVPLPPTMQVVGRSNSIRK